jgi:hypothetical protein
MLVAKLFLFGMTWALVSCGSLNDPMLGPVYDAFSTVEQQQVKWLRFVGVDAVSVVDEVQKSVKNIDQRMTVQAVESPHSDQVRFKVALEGVDYCREEGLVHLIEEDHYHVQMHAPRSIPQSLEAPDAEVSIRFLEQAFPEYSIGDLLRHCYLDLGPDSSSVSVNEWLLHGPQGYYKVLADEVSVYELAPQYFSATATVRAYDTNPVTGSLTNFSVVVDESGYMQNGSFTTTVGQGSRAYSSNFQFVYEPSNGSFKEASAFAHANAQLDFFKSLGFSFSGNTIEVGVSQMIGGTSNNALYTPSSASNPKIQIGDGDGQILQNLPLDSAVVAHELGHHVVFQNLKSTVNQSLVIHEGLADYFALSAANDPCLGRSVCPAGSTLCEVAAQCLRTADNEYVYGVNTSSQPHKASQFISGLLWDLRGVEIPVADLDRIAYRGTTLLLSSSGYYDLVLAWLLADEELFDKQYCSAILNAAQNRGLTQIVSNLSCESDLPNILAVSDTAVPGSSSKKSGGGCTVGSAKDPVSMVWFILPFFAHRRWRNFFSKRS